MFASFQTLINSDFETGLVGAGASTKAEDLQTINLGAWYDPLAKRFTRYIEDPVRVAMRDEEDDLVATYAPSSGPATLAKQFLDDLARTKLWPEDKKPYLKQAIEAIVADNAKQADEKVRLLGAKTYEVFGRPTVQRYIREGRATARKQAVHGKGRGQENS